MGYDELKKRVWRANLDLVETGLVRLTFGNASGVDRAAGVVAIKPSGVPYDRLEADDIVVISLETGQTVEGVARPSSDTPTHLHLYRSFQSIGGVVHTHSLHATTFSQAGRELPCLGTTHADSFRGSVPVTRQLTPEEVAGPYEMNTGVVIVERFVKGGLDPTEVPAVLVLGHGPFTWGKTPQEALENSVVLEYTAEVAMRTWHLNPGAGCIPQYLIDRHFYRKHGAGAYYGQKGSCS